MAGDAPRAREQGGPAAAARASRHRSLHPKKPVHSAIKADINVTPLVDVMLVLLIIFMVVTPMLTRGKDVKLPKAEFFLSQKDNGEQVIVSVTKDADVYLGKDLVTLGTLRQRIGDELRQNKGNVPIVIKADARLPYVRVREVMEAVHDAGAETVMLATDAEKGT